MKLSTRNRYIPVLNVYSSTARVYGVVARVTVNLDQINERREMGRDRTCGVGRQAGMRVDVARSIDLPEDWYCDYKVVMLTSEAKAPSGGVNPRYIYRCARACAFPSTYDIRGMPPNGSYTRKRSHPEKFRMAQRRRKGE